IIAIKNEFSVGKEFFKFNFWVALFTIIAAVSSRLDTFLIARFLPTHEIGIYGAANQLVSIVPQIVGALGIVAAPKFASFANIQQMLIYFKKFQLMVIGLSILGLVAIPLSFYAIPLIYGPLYAETVLPFIILFFAMLIFLVSVPVHNSIIYYFGKSQVFVWVGLGHLLIIGIFGYLLISSYGLIGAAISVLIGMIFNFIAPLIWFLLRIRR
ncbi:MAG: oligosaccharide flippase family protein, partial [Candidatus Daviesbacteria bacterium]|nr:oligosaccharide flippase family protein [Candidatus Daviesbacteria bacterium]